MSRKFPQALIAVIFALFISANAFAATTGGSCPSSSSYMNPNGVGAQGTLSSFGINSCFYIDFVNGSDSNAGTSEGSPWKHAPGMQGCSSNCSSNSPTGGEGFIFKGGVTWDYTTQPWSWGWSGSSGVPIYLGYDPSWFAGSSWSRPVLSASGQESQQMSVSGTFINVDNFEFTGMFNNQPCCSQNVWAFMVSHSGDRSINLYENYFHGANVAHDGMHSSHFISWPTNGDDDTSTTHHNVIDNRDFCTPGSNGHGPCTMTAQEGGPRQIFMQYVGYMGGSSYVVDNPIDFHNNTIEWQTLSVDAGTDHENMFESNGETGSAAVLYNNVVQHGYNCGVVDFQLGPNVGITSYAFNNVLPDMDGCNMQQTYEGSSSLGIVYWFNNTSETGIDSSNPGGVCGRDTGVATSKVINQHCITTLTGNSWWNGSANFTTDLAQSKASAAGEGYTLGAEYSFEPTSTNGSTIGAGTNETSLCNAIGGGGTTLAAVNATAKSACLQDTSYGVTYNISNHTITGVGRASTVNRPSSGSWDIGAYQFSANTIAPPSGLSAVVQ